MREEVPLIGLIEGEDLRKIKSRNADNSIYDFNMKVALFFIIGSQSEELFFSVFFLFHSVPEELMDLIFISRLNCFH